EYVSLIVCHDQQAIGRTLWRHHSWWPVGLGVFGGLFDHAAERRIGWRELIAGNRRGRALGGPGAPVSCCACSGGKHGIMITAVDPNRTRTQPNQTRKKSAATGPK